MDVAPVFRAIAAADLEELERVLAADPGASASRDKKGVSTLLFALYARQEAMVPALRAAGAPIEVFEAAALGDLTLLASIIERDPSAARAIANDGFTPLHLAAFFGRLDCAQLLVRAGADVDAPAKNAMAVRPINSAAAVGATDVVAFLLDAGANPDLAQNGGYTALHSAAHRADLALVKLLLERGAERAPRADDGKVPRDMLPGDAGDELVALLAD